MKKSFTIITLFLSAAIHAQAQKEVLFRMRIMPNHHYDILVKINMNMIMDISGDSVAVRKLKNEGQKFPMVMDMENNVGMDIKTAMPNAQNRIPAVTTIRIHDIKMTVNGQTTPLPIY